MKVEVEKMKIEIKQSSVNIDKELSDDFTTIFTNAKDVTPFMELFLATTTRTHENRSLPWPTINIWPHIMHFRRLVFSYTE